VGLEIAVDVKEGGGLPYFLIVWVREGRGHRRHREHRGIDLFP
jgi:hypothetical protein